MNPVHVDGLDFTLVVESGDLGDALESHNTATTEFAELGKGVLESVDGAQGI